MKLLKTLMKIFGYNPSGMMVGSAVSAGQSTTRAGEKTAEPPKSVASKSKVFIMLGLASVAAVMAGFFLVYFLVVRINTPKEPEFTPKGMVTINSGFANAGHGSPTSPQQDSPHVQPGIPEPPTQPSSIQTGAAQSTVTPVPVVQSASPVIATSTPTASTSVGSAPTSVQSPDLNTNKKVSVPVVASLNNTASRISNYDPFKSEFLKKYKDSGNNSRNGRHNLDDMKQLEDAIKESPKPVMQIAPHPPPPPPPIKKIELKIVVSGIMDASNDKYALTDHGNVRVGNIVDGYMVDKITHDFVSFKHTLDEKDIRDVFVGGTKKDAINAMPSFTQ